MKVLSLREAARCARQNRDDVPTVETSVLPGNTQVLDARGLERQTPCVVARTSDRPGVLPEAEQRRTCTWCVVRVRYRTALPSLTVAVDFLHFTLY